MKSIIRENNYLRCSSVELVNMGRLKPDISVLKNLLVLELILSIYTFS